MKILVLLAGFLKNSAMPERVITHAAHVPCSPYHYHDFRETKTWREEKFYVIEYEGEFLYERWIAVARVEHCKNPTCGLGRTVRFRENYHSGSCSMPP